MLSAHAPEEADRPARTSPARAPEAAGTELPRARASGGWGSSTCAPSASFHTTTSPCPGRAPSSPCPARTVSSWLRRRHSATARVRFAEGAPEHEVAVGCCRTSGRPGEEELWVSVLAVYARRLRWNFRGKQTVFVDVLWDLHGWWFQDPPGCAVVMLRARSALESKLWLEEAAKAPGFALLVQAFKTPP